MAFEAQLAQTYNWALVVDEQELRRLADEALRAVTPEGQEPSTSSTLDLNVRFSDKLSMRLESLDDLLKEENPKRRAITGVELKASTRSAEVCCRIGLEETGASSISIKGKDRQWVYVNFSRIEDRLRRMKQWWHIRYPLMGVACAVVSLLVCVAALTVVQRKYPALFVSPPPPPGSREEASVGTTVGLLVSMAVTGFCGWLGARLFKDPVFRIGDGVERHERTKRIRAWIASVLVVTIGLGLMLQLIGKLLW